MNSVTAAMARNSARWLRERLRGFRRGGQTFRPDFSDAALVARLNRTANNGWAHRRRDAAHGDVIVPLELAAIYFRERAGPRFFAAPGELAAASERVASDRPEWKAATLSRVGAVLTDGLPVYAATSPPMRPGYPWAHVPAGPGTDKLYRKRPHRFAFMPAISLAALYGENVLEDMPVLLSEWMALAGAADNNIFYNSNLAVIQRVLALSWAWAFLTARPPERGATGLALEGMVLKILYGDIQFLAPRLGRSYPNNHLLADGFGGWFIGSVWPEFGEGENWRNAHQAQFLSELRRQILPDGTSFEHSLHYHEMACEMVVAYMILGRLNGLAIPEWVESRSRRMLRFQCELAGPEAVTPRIGDATEEPMFPLDGGDGWAAAAWRELYRGLFDSSYPSASPHAPELERAFWLMGGQLPCEHDMPREAMDAASLCSFQHGGFHVFTDRGGAMRLTFRTAPARGQPICAGHMHADLMGVYLSVGARPCIVDAGTFTYRSKVHQWPRQSPAWRQYFAGPDAHNALSIAGHDPLGRAEGDFRAADSDVCAMTDVRIAERAGAWVEATLAAAEPYDGYRRGIVHIPGEYCLIYDVLPQESVDESCHLGYQLATGAVVSRLGDAGAELDIGGVAVRLHGSKQLLGPDILCGSFDPIGGWVSKHYGELSEAPQLRFPVQPGARRVATLLEWGPGTGSPPRIVIENAADDGLVIKISRRSTEDVFLLRRPGARAPFRHGEFEFDGDLLWLRWSGGQVSELRWLRGRLLAMERQSLRVESASPMASLEIRRSDAGPVLRHEPDIPVEISWPERT